MLVTSVNQLWPHMIISHHMERHERYSIQSLFDALEEKIVIYITVNHLI